MTLSIDQCSEITVDQLLNSIVFTVAPATQKESGCFPVNQEAMAMKSDSSTSNERQIFFEIDVVRSTMLRKIFHQSMALIEQCSGRSGKNPLRSNFFLVFCRKDFFIFFSDRNQTLS